MATQEDALEICSEMAGKLRQPVPKIFFEEYDVRGYASPVVQIGGKMAVSPACLVDLTLQQLRICIAYAIAAEARTRRLMKWGPTLCGVVALPIVGFYVAYQHVDGFSLAPFWAAIAMALAMILFLTVHVAFISPFGTDKVVYQLTNDLAGMEEHLTSGGFYTKNGEPMKPNAGFVRKRLAALTALAKR